MRYLLIITAVALSCGSIAQAAGTGEPHRKRAAAHAQPTTGADTHQLWSDLVHGSAEQRAVESEDNDRAHVKPVDHSKDDFFSDWRGLK